MSSDRIQCRAPWRRELSAFFGAFTPPVLCLLGSYVSLTIVFALAVQLYGPFLRTLVICNRPGTGPGAIGGAAFFTGSSFCDDAPLVLAVAQAQEGRLIGMKLLVHGCSGPFVAVFADSRGRRPVLLMGLGGFFTAFVLFAVVAACPWLHQNTHLLAFCFIVEGATGAFDITYLSMLADLAPNERDRSKLFTAHYAVGSCSSVMAQLASVSILRRQIDDYTRVWSFLALALLATLAFVFVFVGESLPTAKGRGGSAGCLSRTSLLNSLAAPLRLVLRHRFLSFWLVGISLGHLAHGLSNIEASFTLAAYGWMPGDLQACTWPGQLAQVWALVVLGPFLSRCRASRVIFITVLLHCGASLAEILAPFSPSLLVAPSLLAQLVVAVGRPSATAFLTSHFPVDQQAKLHSVTHLCSNLSTSLSIMLFSTVLFAPNTTDGASTMPFCLAALFTCSGGGVRLALVLSEMSGAARQAKKVAEEVEAASWVEPVAV